MAWRDPAKVESKENAEMESDDVVQDLAPMEDLISYTWSRIDSFSSVSSIYSADGGKGSYGITGTIQVGVWFKNNVLFMRVVRAKGLAAAKSGGVSDPYVKTYLLPDKTKHTKRKTAIQRKTTNPEYNETLKNKLLQSDIKLCTLWLSVWDWDKFGRNKFLGEVRLPLSSMDLTDSSDHIYTLQDRHQPCEAVYRGKLKFAIKYEPSTASKNKTELLKGSLIVSVKEAKDLPQMDPNGLTDSFVKTYLLPKRCPVAKKKTSLVKGTLNPAWNEELEYKHVYLSDLRTRVLELTVWDYDRRGCNDFIGCLRLGPSPVKTSSKKEWMDSTEKEAEQWEEMLAHPGEWVEYEHDLRPSIESSAKCRTAIPTPTPESAGTSSTQNASSLCSQEPSPEVQNQTTSSIGIESDENIQGRKETKVLECRQAESAYILLQRAEGSDKEITISESIQEDTQVESADIQKPSAGESDEATFSKSGKKAAQVDCTDTETSKQAEKGDDLGESMEKDRQSESTAPLPKVETKRSVENAPFEENTQIESADVLIPLPRSSEVISHKTRPVIQLTTEQNGMSLHQLPAAGNEDLS